MRVYLVVKSFIPQNLVQEFDKWYHQEHLPEAKKAFNAISAFRGWSIDSTNVHHAYYQFKNQLKANEVLEGENLKKMIDVYDKKWSKKITRTREVIKIFQKI